MFFKKLRTLFIGATLGFGALSGIAMRPEEIAELMSNMSRPKVAHVLKQQDQNSDPPSEPVADQRP